MFVIGYYSGCRKCRYSECRQIQNQESEQDPKGQQGTRSTEMR